MPVWQQTSALVGLLLGGIGLVLLVPRLLAGLEPTEWGWLQGALGLLVIGLALAALAQGKWVPTVVVLVLGVVALAVLIWMRAAGHGTGSPSWALMVACAALVLASVPVASH